MANPKIKFKRSSVANKTPTLASLELGELALNTYDGKLFVRRDTSGVGIATTVTTINPWTEDYGGDVIRYTGDVIVTGIVSATSLSGDGSGLTNVGMDTSNVSGDTVQAGIITATSQFYPPSLTSVERDSLSFNAGAFIFNETENKLQMYLGGEWKNLAFELDTYSTVGL